MLVQAVFDSTAKDHFIASSFYILINTKFYHSEFGWLRKYFSICREIIGAYTVVVRESGKKILDLIYEGLRLTGGNFDNYDLGMTIHN